ncbi:MAG: VanZ family protein [Pseudomonadota bacterium]
MPASRPRWLVVWHDRRRLWAALAVLAAFTIALGSLTPGSEMPSRLPWDKLNHFLGYAGLAGLVGLAGLRLSLAFVVTLLYGAVIEVAQLAVPGRSGGDPADLLANAIGAGAAVLLLSALRRGLRLDDR